MVRQTSAATGESKGNVKMMNVSICQPLDIDPDSRVVPHVEVLVDNLVVVHSSNNIGHLFQYTVDSPYKCLFLFNCVVSEGRQNKYTLYRVGGCEIN